MHEQVKWEGTALSNFACLKFSIIKYFLKVKFGHCLLVMLFVVPVLRAMYINAQVCHQTSRFTVITNWCSSANDLTSFSLSFLTNKVKLITSLKSFVREKNK